MYIFCLWAVEATSEENGNARGIICMFSTKRRRELCFKSVLLGQLQSSASSIVANYLLCTFFTSDDGSTSSDPSYSLFVGSVK